VRIDAVFIAGGGSGPRLIWARSGPWLRLRRQLDATHCVAFSSTIVPAGVTGSVGAAGLANDGGGLFWRQDEDLSDTYSHRSGGSVVFRISPPVYSTGRFMPGDCQLGWDSVMRTHVFYLIIWFQ
jgi:hypothetical protein